MHASARSGPATGQSQLAALEAPRPLLLVQDRVLEGELHELEEISQTLETHTHSPGTRRAYAKVWRSFESFCLAHLEDVPSDAELAAWANWLGGDESPLGLQ